MSRRAINAKGAATVGPYSHAVDAGDLIFLSGQTPMDPSTGLLVAGSIARQTEQCLQNLFTVLDATGLSSEDVVSVQVYLTSMEDFAEMNAAYARHFTSPYPARTTIGCAGLPLNARVEIAMIARRPGLQDPSNASP
jgi:2-iminobutanoate/2-iminopropanoate deaminase